MSRGNAGGEIVDKPSEYQRFLDVVARVKASSDFQIYAYCLMPNHFHALLRVFEDPLSHFMHRIQSSWAKRFNLARDRRGHVFQDRYKSKHCADDTYCRWLLRYIHVNPVASKLTRRPEDWKWSSYRQYLGISDGISDIDWPLSLFGGNRASLAAFVLQGAGEPALPAVMDDSRPKKEPARENAPAVSISFDGLAAAVASELGIAVEILFHGWRGPQRSVARRRLVVRALASGLKAAEIARRLGVSRTAVSKMAAAAATVATVPDVNL
jgi:REP element-mobilizing transposase RayT